MNMLSLSCPGCGKWLEVENWKSDNLTITLFTWCECGRYLNGGTNYIIYQFDGRKIAEHAIERAIKAEKQLEELLA